jgi:diguanylate cyclase (GGDEF)-like protein
MKNVIGSFPVPAHSILLVDDTPANIKLLSAYLEKNGFSVVSAANGEGCLQTAKAVQPDLILLDVMMPVMDGFETCRRLKADSALSDIPVIFMSSLSETHDKLAGFRAGGVDYLTKPFQIEEVLARVRTHLTLRALQRQLKEQNQQLQQQIVVQRQMEAELKQAHDKLEERVAQRTAELSDAKAVLAAENNERQQAEQRANYLSHYDALTGLPNRSLMQDRVRQAIAYAHRNQSQLAVLFVDLDYFKHINESMGHHAGDLLLQAVALRLQQCLREGDSVARLGGDEFVLCLSLIEGGGDAASIAQKTLDTLDQVFIVNGHELHVSASIGISIYPDNGADVESLMRTADTAMYHAKEKGRSNYQFFTPSLNKAAQHRLALTNRLRRALAHNDFAVFFQPQVDIESGTIFSAEALLRYRHGKEKMPISCGPFMTIAEETGLIVPIGEWILRESCKQLRHWHDLGFTQLHIAVNLSPRQCRQPNFYEIVQNILEETGLPARALNLEITENTLLQRNEENVEILEQLSSMGIELSVDDFGTGYSSLAYLQRFPINSLKIDRSFIQGIGHDSNNTALVSAIIAMANSLDLNVLAEGVETQQQASFLMEQGCPAAQGYYYSQALSSQAFLDLLRCQNATRISV